MQKTFTLSAFYLRIPLFLILLLAGTFQELYGQCTDNTPVYEVDLTGQPGGSWTSPSINRNGNCCNADKKYNCVQFNITLDRLSGGLQFEITDGPMPSGAMSYQINCEAPIPVGDSICVTGTGPHVLTICMPGGATNSFTVRSIAAYEPVADADVTGGCSATLEAPIAFDPASVQWNDITGGGAYNSYLSCASGCGTTTVTPDANPPAFVDYVICGNSQAAVCSSIPYCDTVRVYFHDPIVASISPDPAIICPGNGSVELVGSATGGSGYYDYFWFDESGNLLANAQTYNATAVGTYQLEVRNENYPSCTPFTSTVTVSDNLSVNAGPDQEVCANEAIQLSGTVNAATGGIWSGGAGTFSPDNTTLNALYTPTAQEIANGNITLTLTSTGNGSCSPVSDNLSVSFHSFSVSINAPPILCTGSTTTLSAAISGGTAPFSYSWSTGEATQNISNKPAGTYTVAVTDSKNCAFQATTTVATVNSPSDFTATTTSTTCGAGNGSIEVVSVTDGTAPYSYSLDGINFQTSSLFTGLTATTHQLTVKDANGCTFSKEVIISDIAGPTDFTTSLIYSSCGEQNGQITIASVAGGTGSYTYSIDGTNFQSGPTFGGLAAEVHTLWVKDANNCTFSKAITLTNQAGPTAITAAVQPASCTNNNGSIEVTSVSGGTAPFSYSIDGTNFQTSASFTNLAAGTYTVSARDQNGCMVATTATVNKVEPVDLAATLSPSTCSEPNGQIVVNTVSGGISPYSYSIDGTSFQASNTFTNLTAGNFTISIKDANGCIYSENVIITDQAGPSDIILNQTASTCGAANGQITIAEVSGGTAPFTYSKDGTNFQTGSSFTGLLAGSFNIMVKDANGCTFSKSVTVNNIAGPADVAISPISSTCGNANGELLVEGVTGGTSPYTYSLDGTTFQSSTSFGGLKADSYTLTVKDANGCTITKGTTISNIPGPTNFTPTLTSSTCGNANGKIEVGTVTGGTAPYIYSIDGGSFTGSAVFTGLISGARTLTVKDANGCSITKTLSLQNIAGPTAVNTASQAASCSDDDGGISVSSVNGGTAPYTYSINGGAFQASTSFANLPSGTYTLIARDANGCSVTTSVEVDKLEPTDLTATLSSSTCTGANGKIVISTVSGGTGPYTYSLDGTNFQASNTFSGLMASTYTLRVKDAKGCLYSEGVLLEDQPAPTAMELSQTPSHCSLANGSIKVGSITGGTAPFTYSIDGINFQTGASFSAIPAGEHTIAVKDANGCTFAKDIMVTDVPGPSDLSITSSTTTCGNANGTLTVTATTGGTAPYSYSVDGINFQLSGSFSNLTANTYTVSVKDANGCLYAEEVILEDQAGPSDFTATTTSSTCGDPNGQITISSVVNGTTPYSYSADGINFQASPTLSGLLAGTYNILIKDANGCTFSKEVALGDIPGPTAINASSQPATCLGNDGSIEVASVVGGSAPFTYSLDGSAFQSSTTFTSIVFGSHTISAKDANGCIFSTEVIVERIGPMDMSFIHQPSNCGENNGAITIKSVSGGATPYTYSIDGSTFGSPEVFGNLAAGIYTIWVKDANGCTYSEETSLSDIGGVTAADISLHPTTCGISNGEITINGVTDGTSPYTYSLDGGNFQSSSTFTALAAATYILQIKDANGCIYTEEVVLEDIPAPSGITVSSAASTCSDANGSLSVNAVNGGTAPYSYSIDGANFQSSTIFPGLVAGTYTVTVKDANGCIYEEETIVTDIPGPTAMELAPTSSSCGDANGSIIVEEVTGGNEPYAYSLDGTTFQNNPAFENLLAGNYEVWVKDVNGCFFRKAVTVTDIAGPSALNLKTTATSCANNEGSIEISAVNGGSSPYTYSINGTDFQTETSFTGLASGSYTVVVKDVLGCIFSTTASVDRIEPTDLQAEVIASTCGNSNGQISIPTVSGGVAPYTYSIGGINFQSSSVFTGLSAGTYTMLVKDANGCTYSEKVVLNNLAGPSAISTSVASSTCGNSNGVITIAEVTGGSAPYTYSINGSEYQDNATFDGLAAGDYQITVKDANGCTYAEKVTLQDIPGPDNMILLSTSSTCGAANGEIVVSEINGGTSPYAYSIDGNNFQSGTAFAGIPANTYTITVKDANGCTFSKEVLVENIAGPEQVEAVSTPSTCGVADGSIEAGEVTGGRAPYTFSLNGSAYQTEKIFNGIAAGEHLLQAKDANGCVVERRVQVTNTGGPTDMTATSTPATCSQSNGSITVNSVEGTTAPYTYSVDGTNFQSQEVFQNLKGGTYSIFVKDINGCLYLEEVKVGDETAPSAITAIITPTSCTIDNGTISIELVSGGKSPFSYSLDGENYQSRNSFSALAADIYTIFVKDANGCIATFEEKVITTGPQSAEVSITNASCGKSDGSISVGTVSGGTLPYSYSIDGLNFLPTSTFTGLAAGIYTLYVQDASGCTLLIGANISNNGGPEDFTLTIDNANCGLENGIVEFGEVTGGTAPFSYSIDGNTYQSNPVFSGLADGEYQLSVKDANGCLTFKPAQISNIEGPSTFTLTSNAANCGMDNGTITVEAVTGGNSPYSYSLDGLNYQASATFGGLAGGSYTIFVKDANGCTISETIIIEEIEGPSEIHFSSINASCEDSGEVHVEEVSGGTAPYLYSLDGAFYQSAPHFTNLRGGAYTLYVADANNCIINTPVLIEQPDARLDYLRSVSCYGAADGEIAFRTSGTEGNPQFSIDGGATFQSDSVFRNLGPGEYTVFVKLTESCTREIKELIITEPEALVAELIPTAGAIGDQASGSAELRNIRGGIPPYSFSVDNGPFGTDSVFLNLAAGEHEVVLQDATGCKISFSFQTDLIQDIEIPNSFTPNGDGINDYWVLRNISILFPQCKVAVYNRWGLEVFSSTGYAREWDGTNKGKILPDGTYYFILQFDETKAPEKGSVTIMR